jgi:hypothetical protein
MILYGYRTFGALARGGEAAPLFYLGAGLAAASLLIQIRRPRKTRACFWPILLKNSVFKIADFSFAICRKFCIVDTRR